MVVASVLWVQVPQWSDDWSKCAVDVPDAACHWYVSAPDNTFGKGFSWKNANIETFLHEQSKDIAMGVDSKNNKDDSSKKKNEKNQNRKPGQLSPEQIKSILEAMNNQEKNVQKKINAKKVKGSPVKNVKDW